MAFKKIEVPKEGLKVANTYIKIGSTYEVAHKYDGSAPDGMQEIGATKFPLTGVAEVKSVYFDERRNTTDSGFYIESLCNSRIPQAEREELVRLYEGLIKIPYEKRMNRDCSETNLSFWDNYKYEVKVNKSFDTSDPKDLFDLFHALKQGTICNEGEKDATLQKARYTIKNIEAVRSKEDEKLDNKIEAMTIFNTLLDSDIEKVYTVLEYLQASNPRNMEKEALRRTYIRILDDSKKGTEFVKRFLEASKKYNSEQGKLEMQYFALVQKLFLKNGITKKAGALYHEDGTYLANTPKDIAIKCAMGVDKDYSDKIDELYQKYFGE
jgi:hypothetical protein